MGSAPLLVGVSFLDDLPKIIGFLTGGGFAVFVSVWFMVRLDHRLKELSDAVTALRVAIAMLKPDDKPSGGSGMSGTGRNRGD